MNEIPVKRPRGRPRKNPLPDMEREPLREPVKTNKYNMRAQPNWVDVDPNAIDSPDRLRIDPSLIPNGMSAMWVTSTVLGQPVHQHRAEFERKGWTPVHQSDFDGQFDGLFMPKGAEGEINQEGLVLMVRPVEMTKKAQLADKKRAYEQVRIKEQALTGGDVGATLDSRHPTALGSNKINRSMERIEIPEN